MSYVLFIGGELSGNVRDLTSEIKYVSMLGGDSSDLSEIDDELIRHFNDKYTRKRFVFKNHIIEIMISSRVSIIQARVWLERNIKKDMHEEMRERYKETLKRRRESKQRKSLHYWLDDSMGPVPMGHRNYRFSERKRIYS